MESHFHFLSIFSLLNFIYLLMNFVFQDILSKRSSFAFSTHVWICKIIDAAEQSRIPSCVAKGLMLLVQEALYMMLNCFLILNFVNLQGFQAFKMICESYGSDSGFALNTARLLNDLEKSAAAASV